MWEQPTVRDDTTYEDAPHHPARKRRRQVNSIAAAVFAGAMAVSGLAKAQAPVLTINNEFLNVTRLTSALLVAGPPEVAREMAIFTSAMFDGANAASGLTYAPVAYAGPAVSGASVDAAALSAGYTALRAIFANDIWHASPGGNLALQTAMVNRIDATYTAAVSSLSGSTASIAAGLALGVTAGNANLTARGYTPGNNAMLALDGSSSAILNGISMPYTAPAFPLPGQYIPPNQSPGGGRIAMFPQWGTVAPVGLTTGQMTALEAAVPGPPPVTDPNSSYATNLLQTQCQGAGAPQTAIANICAAAGFGTQTAAMAKSALFWNDPGSTEQPPGHWLDIVDTLIQTQGLSTLNAARMASLVSQAEADAGIGAWAIKYQDTLWRPVTAIHDCTGWNASFTTCDPTWTSLIATPPHPDYLAGHPAFSGAAAKVLTNYLGPNVGFNSTSDTYCNGGGSATWRSATTSLVVACTVSAGTSSFAMGGGATFYGTAADCTAATGAVATDGGGNALSCTLGGTAYFFNTAAGCGAAGGTVTPGGGGTQTCALNTKTYSFLPSDPNYGTGCNNIVNGGANDSPLICPITETFATFEDASSGVNGSTFSRVAGGIHTPFAVLDAQTLGEQIGQLISSENNIPEPGTLALLAFGLSMTAGLRRYRLAPSLNRAAASTGGA